MKPYQIKQYYLKEGILDKIFSLCQNREVVPVFENGQFGKRPSAMLFKGDLESLIKEGVTSFHASVELWKNPLLLKSDMRSSDLNKIREGWDLVFDVDCDYSLEFAKETVLSLIDALKQHGVDNISVKFSGSRGFHIGIPHNSFPKEVNYKKISLQFPELAQQILGYLKYKIKDELTNKLIEIESNIKEKITLGDDKLDPYKIVDVEQNWGTRHLFRLPYCLNEKKWLVSVPLNINKIKDFQFNDAKPENVSAELGFLDKWELDETKDLIMEAIDWQTSIDMISNLESKDQRTYTPLGFALSPESFPPCIKLISKGIRDGRKRSVFILINFLRTVGWDWNSIGEFLKEWNEKNPDPLKNVYISTQLTWHKRRNKAIPPPNCDNKGYYKDIGVCKPDNLCRMIKNPANYSIRKSRAGRRRRTKK